MPRFIVEDNTKEFYKKLQINEGKFLLDVANFIGEKMDYYVPVASGYLKSRNNVKVDLDSKEIEAKNDADYAGFVEKGTSTHRAQPFITPSVYNHIKDIENIAKRGLGDGIR